MVLVAADMAVLPAVGPDTTLDSVLDIHMAEDGNLTVWADFWVEVGTRRAQIVEDSWPCFDAIDWRAGKKQAKGEGRQGQWDNVASTE